MEGEKLNRNMQKAYGDDGGARRSSKVTDGEKLGSI